MRVFNWFTPIYQTAANAQICDIEGHRLHVRRIRKGAREFTALIDGKDLRWKNETLEDAKAALEAHFELTFADYGKLD